MKMVLSLLCVLLMPTLSRADNYIRYKDDQLQTATVTLIKNNVTVDLVSVVHIGDKEYYRALNKKLTTYDVLLYELVAPKGTIPQRSSGLSLSKMLLGIEHQTDRIKYDRPNFVHADLSLQEMRQALAKRGETPLSFGLRIVADMMMDKKETAPINLSSVPELKKSLAQNLANTNGTGIKTLDKLLIGDRNAKCMEVFNQQVQKGHRKIGIFYGAAHMPDFERRFLKMGYKHQATEWLTAWDLSDD